MLSSGTYQQILNASKKERRQYIELLNKKYDLDYRTAMGLTKLIISKKLTEEEAQKYMDKEYYTFSNVIELAKDDMLHCLIPISFYENDEFLQETGITCIPSYFAFGCQTIHDFHINARITEIGEKAFYSCGNLKVVTAQQRKEKIVIGKKAFYDCIRLKEVLLHAPIEIGTETFLNCLSLHNIEADIITLESGAFDGCVMISAMYMPKLKIIGKRAFHDCIRLEDIKVPLVKKIDEYAFQNCYSLEDVRFDNIEEINKGAFQSSGLVTLKLNGIEQIEETAFGDCEYLETLKIQSMAVSEVKENAFQGCTSLNTIMVNGNIYDTKNMSCYEILTNTLKNHETRGEQA